MPSVCDDKCVVVYARSAFDRSSVKTQNPPKIVSRTYPTRRIKASVASAVAGVPVTNANPYMATVDSHWRTPSSVFITRS